MRNRFMLAGLAAGISLLTLGAAQAVEIEYWQYAFETRVTAMDQLIANFEAANPDITVKQTTFPYDDYQTRVIAAKAAGQGPDVLQMFYGWLDKFQGGGVLQPLSPTVFPSRCDRGRFLPHRHRHEARRRLLRPADRGALAGAVL